MTSRRDFLRALTATSTAAAVAAATRPVIGYAAAADASSLPVSFALNTSTIRGQELPLDKQIEVTAAAGYDGIEPWIRDIQSYAEKNSLSDLRKRIEDLGLSVVSAIGFASWIVDDPQQRAAGLEQARKDMELVKQLGGNHIAAPPVGAHRAGGDMPSLDVIAERYRALCEVGKEAGVWPQLELWGFSPTLSTLGELAYVATEAQHEYACVLPDFYHIYKGGNDFAGLAMIEASRMHCFHINDYPAEPPLKEIADRHRVFPGDGVCPLARIIRDLIDNGFRGAFSLELFNPDYWKRDAAEVAKEGLKKSRSVVHAAMQLDA